MKLITLHDQVNPDREVEVDADSIVAVTPFGSGSAISFDGEVIGVSETPEQVKAIADGQ